MTDLQEHLASIDRAIADHHRKRQEVGMAPWKIAATLLAGSAGCFAAGAAFIKLLDG